MEHLGPTGWHPDPSNPTQLRYYDGTAWTEHVSPAAAPAYAAPAHQSVVTNVVMAQAAPPKSVGLAFLLTFLFGPFGLLYVSVVGAIVMIVVNIVGGALTFGILNLILWPVEMVWGIVAAQNANKAAVVPSGMVHSAQPAYEPPAHVAPPHSQNWASTPAQPPAPAPPSPSAPVLPEPPPHPAIPQPAALPARTGVEDPFTALPAASTAPASSPTAVAPPAPAAAPAPSSEALPPPRPRPLDEHT